MSLLAVLATALVTGLVGSGHCAAMCGGIAAALARSPGAALLNALGRVTSYAAAGALVAGAAGAIGSLAPLQSLRTVVVWATAVALLAIGLRVAGLVRGRWVDGAGARAWRVLQPLTRGLARVPAPLRPLAAGLVWGWLPCGMAYAMLALAAARADALEGALVMAAFGLGTVPVLAALASAAGFGSRLTRSPKLRLAAGLAIVALGIAGVVVESLPADPADHAHHAHHD